LEDSGLALWALGEGLFAGFKQQINELPGFINCK